MKIDGIYVSSRHSGEMSGILPAKVIVDPFFGAVWRGMGGFDFIGRVFGLFLGESLRFSHTDGTIRVDRSCFI